MTDFQFTTPKTQILSQTFLKNVQIQKLVPRPPVGPSENPWFFSWVLNPVLTVPVVYLFDKKSTERLLKSRKFSGRGASPPPQTPHKTETKIAALNPDPRNMLLKLFLTKFCRRERAPENFSHHICRRHFYGAGGYYQAIKRWLHQ